MLFACLELCLGEDVLCVMRRTVYRPQKANLSSILIDSERILVVIPVDVFEEFDCVGAVLIAETPFAFA